MQKIIDKITGSGVPLTCLLNTSIHGNRTRKICGIFVSGVLKGTLGWAGNISNTCRSLVCAVLNIPALDVLNPFNRSHTMYTFDKSYHANVHPHDLISRCISKINLLNSSLVSEKDFGVPDDVIDGFYYSFLAISQELEIALHKLQEVRK